MDTLNFLYLALGIGFIILVIFICATLVYLIQILRDVTKISENVKDTAEKVNHFILQPLTFMKEILEYAKPVIHAVQSKKDEVRENVGEFIKKTKKTKKHH